MGWEGETKRELKKIMDLHKLSLEAQTYNFNFLNYHLQDLQFMHL